MRKIQITLIMLMVALPTFAQQREVRDRGFMGANPKQLEQVLTTDQQEVINSLRTTLKIEMITINNQLLEKRAQLRNLQQVDSPDMKAINKKIDEITQLQNKKMKMVVATEAKIREQLTPEQRADYDLRKGKRIGRETFGRKAPNSRTTNRPFPGR